MSSRSAGGERIAEVAAEKSRNTRIRLTLVLLAVLIVSSAAAAQARTTSARIYVEDFSPSWSPDGKKIVFARTREVVDPRNGECCLLVGSTLHVMDAGGGNLRRIPGGALDSEPGWSPDGKLIAFLRRPTRAGRDRLFVMRPDGTGARAVRRDSLDQGSPAWSPNGTEIAFWRGGLRRGGIYAVRADGSGFRRIVANADYGGPAWSPDGQRLAFGRGYDVYVVNADGSKVHRLTRAFPAAYYEPVWSPDGRRLVFRSELGLYVMQADGTGIHRITRADSELSQDASPAWSPGGRWIAFSGYRRPPNEARIYRVGPNGRGLKRLTTIPRR